MTAAAPRAPRPTVAQSLASQMRFLALTVSPGLDGYRIAFTAGTEFERISDHKDLISAHQAARAARELTGALMRRVFA